MTYGPVRMMDIVLTCGGCMVELVHIYAPVCLMDTVLTCKPRCMMYRYSVLTYGPGCIMDIQISSSLVALCVWWPVLNCDSDGMMESPHLWHCVYDKMFSLVVLCVWWKILTCGPVCLMECSLLWSCVFAYDALQLTIFQRKLSQIDYTIEYEFATRWNNTNTCKLCT